MIIDKIKNWEFYLSCPAWNSAFNFLMSLEQNTEDGEYQIQGNEIYAKVISYKTRGQEDALLEAHRDYIDIQTVLIGAEGIEWFPTTELTTDKPYDKVKDAEFFIRPYQCLSRVDICPGIFAVLFPQDAHMPTLMVGGSSEHIKKVVVKVKVELITGR